MQMRWQCEAHNWALVAEYGVLNAETHSCVEHCLE